MEPLGVHHVAIKTLDVRRLVDFYMGVLGLTETHRNVDGDGLRSIWLRCGTVTLMIERSATGGERMKTPFESDPPGLHLVALAIAPDARSAWSKRLRDAGFNVLHETDFTLYVHDPDGNRVGLTTWPTPSRSP